MKRYLLFVGADYYPRGGWDDFKGDFDTIEEAKEKLSHCYDRATDWYQIVDSVTKQVVVNDSLD